MSAIWVSVFLGAAVVAAALGAACALAALRIPGRTVVALPAMVVMVASTADMIVPGLQLLGPLAWAALLVGAALLALLDRRRRVPAAHHAAALLLMAVMWVAMLPAALPAPTSLTAAASAGRGTLVAAGAALGHSGHGLVPAGNGMMLGWLVVAASVALAASAVRAARRHGRWHEAAVADRLEAAQHVSMALAMTAMAAGMFLPLIGT
jgi:hypothetical protein